MRYLPVRKWLPKNSYNLYKKAFENHLRNVPEEAKRSSGEALFAKNLNLHEKKLIELLTYFKIINIFLNLKA
jgi:hypothetical protein